MDVKRKLVSWLRDAHAIEQHVEKVLQDYAVSARAYPNLNAKYNEHLAATADHKEQLEACLESLGGTPSDFESVVAKILGASQAAATTIAGDAVLTNLAAAYSLEHLEIATLTAIAAAAETCERRDVAETCREIMAEDVAMASWLLGFLPELTRAYLGHPAKG